MIESCFVLFNVNFFAFHLSFGRAFRRRIYLRFFVCFNSDKRLVHDGVGRAEKPAGPHWPQVDGADDDDLAQFQVIRRREDRTPFWNIFSLLKGSFRLIHASVDSAVDCVNAEIGIFLSLWVNATIQCGILRLQRLVWLSLQMCYIFQVRMQQIGAFLQRYRKNSNFPRQLSAKAACVKDSPWESAIKTLKMSTQTELIKHFCKKMWLQRLSKSCQNFSQSILGNFIFFKWANPGLFLFIFVLFNNYFTEKL